MNGNDTTSVEGKPPEQTYAANIEMRNRGESTVSPGDNIIRGVHLCYSKGHVEQGFTHVSNEVSTSQYTAYNFVPKNLLVQFSKPANWYAICAYSAFSLAP